jgi:hypothetical protein
MLRKILPIILTLAMLLFLTQLGLYVYRHFTLPPLPPGEPGQVALPSVSQQSAIGINANEIHYEDASIPFIDLFRVSSPFAENVLGLHSENVTYDANGWPTDLHGGEAGTKFLGKLPPDILPQGDYTVLYDGVGKLRYGHDVKVVSQSPGSELIRFDAGADGLLDASVVITQTDPANPLRNIRILPPGGICQRNPLKWVMQASECDWNAGDYLPFSRYYDSIVFNPDYLNFMKDFKAIRFMGMSGITRNPVEHWQDRPRKDEANWGGTYGARGVPVEVMVDLANRLNKDAWFNLPHAADDEYVRQFATYVRDHLNPKLKVYVEYTNEAWNTTFSHNEYVQKKGIEMGLGINAVEAGYQYYTIRARQVFAVWEQVFGGRERFVRVLGSWDSRPDITKKLLSYDNTYQQVDAVAIAPYFGGNTKGFRESSTVDDIFNLTTAEDSYRSLPEVLRMVKKQAELAQQFGVSLLGYEGGQGLVDWVTRDANQHPNPLFFAANRDPRMGKLYAEFLSGWEQSGGKLLMLFSAPRTCQWYGCWGLKEHIRQPREQAYKYDAVLSFIAARAQWWQEQQQAKPQENPLPPTKPRNPDDPVIVWRPAADPERFFMLENPRTLDVLLETKDWAKHDSFGKWQGKWDDEYLYLTVRVYDEKIVHDSVDPTDDDSIELFFDADNSRAAQPDGKNDFRLVFACNLEHPVLGAGSAPVSDEQLASINTDMRSTPDGYLLEAWIPWKVFGIAPKVKDRVAVEVEINDDDDGGTRDKKIGWVATDNHAANEPKQWGVILFSGR